MRHAIAPVLGEATVQDLREAVRGEIVIPGDDGYADACRLRRRPASDTTETEWLTATGRVDTRSHAALSR
jgi:hypothetical protein